MLQGSFLLDNTSLPPKLVAGEGENTQTTVAVGSILLMKLGKDSFKLLSSRHILN